MSEEYWYRVEDTLVGRGYIDVHGEYVSTGSYVDAKVWKYRVLKHTPKGVRLDAYSRYSYNSKGRFVKYQANKQFACPTEELAWASFRHRKVRQRLIYESKLRRANEAIKLADNYLNKVSPPAAPLVSHRLD